METMNLSAPKKWTFLAGVILWIVALLVGLSGFDNRFPMIIGLGAAYWLGMLGGLVLILGNVLEGF
jgi:hypothetical protein